MQGMWTLIILFYNIYERLNKTLKHLKHLSRLDSATQHLSHCPLSSHMNGLGNTYNCCVWIEWHRLKSLIKLLNNWAKWESVCLPVNMKPAPIWSQQSFHPFNTDSQGWGLDPVFLKPAVRHNQQENETSLWSWEPSFWGIDRWNMLDI